MGEDEVHIPLTETQFEHLVSGYLATVRVVGEGLDYEDFSEIPLLNYYGYDLSGFFQIYTESEIENLLDSPEVKSQIMSDFIDSFLAPDLTEWEELGDGVLYKMHSRMDNNVVVEVMDNDGESYFLDISRAEDGNYYVSVQESTHIRNLTNALLKEWLIPDYNYQEGDLHLGNTLSESTYNELIPSTDNREKNWVLNGYINGNYYSIRRLLRLSEISLFFYTSDEGDYYDAQGRLMVIPVAVPTHRGGVERRFRDVLDSNSVELFGEDNIVDWENVEIVLQGIVPYVDFTIDHD
jgi:hypothetical protein